MLSTAVGAYMRQLRKCSPSLLQRLLVMKDSREVLNHCSLWKVRKSSIATAASSVQFQRNFIYRSTQQNTAAYNFMFNLLLLYWKNIYILSLYIGINVCRLFLQNNLHKFSMTHFSLYPSNTIYPLPFIQSNWPSVPFLRTWMTTTNPASIGWNCMNNVTLKYKIRLLYPLIV